MKIISFFAGAGGLDLGFNKAGFDVVWANEYDKEIWETYRKNHLNTILDERSILDIKPDEIPECDGIIGGPPCQSWSEAGSLKGIEDKRGQLFFDFIRILEAKKPKFFLAENVSGMMAPRHSQALENIKKMLTDAGYNLTVKLLNAADYEVPQDRKRLIFVGFRKDLNKTYTFPDPVEKKLVLEDAIWDLKDNVVPALEKNYSSRDNCEVPNHEYMIGGFSSIFLSRNRVRSWDQRSFTIQAGGRHAPIHPQAPKMVKIETNKQIFEPGFEKLYRRLSVRECARVQTFPDDFVFHYDKIAAGYKMIGNAVPVNLGYNLALEIKKQLAGTTDNLINADLKNKASKLEAQTVD